PDESRRLPPSRLCPRPRPASSRSATWPRQLGVTPRALRHYQDRGTGPLPHRLSGTCRRLRRRGRRTTGRPSITAPARAGLPLSAIRQVLELRDAPERPAPEALREALSAVLQTRRDQDHSAGGDAGGSIGHAGRPGLGRGGRQGLG
ncbi:hypothetical protein ACRAWD_10285, partial [Caulobacter segnis]